MKIRFLNNTNIRQDITDLSIPPAGVIFGGTVLEVENNVYSGQKIDGVHLYFRDPNGWYYWSGKAMVLSQDLPAPIESTSLESPSIPRLSPSPTQVKLFQHPPENNQDLLIEVEQVPLGKSLSETTSIEKHTNNYPSIDAIHSKNPANQPQANAIFANKIPTYSSSVPNEQEYTPIKNQASSPTMQEQRKISFGESPPKTSFSQAPQIPTFLNTSVFSSPQNSATQNNHQYSGIALTGEQASSYRPITEHNIPKLYWEQKGLTGASIKVALLDTGYSNTENTHIRLEHLRNCQQPGSYPEDLDGHGTFCANLIGGSKKEGYIGIAPNCSMLIEKIKNKNHEEVSVYAIKESIRTVVEKGASIILINHCLNATQLSVEDRNHLQQFFKEYSSKGIIFVAPVGESELIKSPDYFPSFLEECLAIGAYGSNQLPLRNSARSRNLDILSPSGSIYFPSFPRAATGVAAAYTTGVLALVMEWGKKHHVQLLPNDVRQLLKNTAANTIQNRSIEAGFGNLNPVEIMQILEKSLQ